MVGHTAGAGVGTRRAGPAGPDTRGRILRALLTGSHPGGRSVSVRSLSVLAVSVLVLAACTGPGSDGDATAPTPVQSGNGSLSGDSPVTGTGPPSSAPSSTPSGGDPGGEAGVDTRPVTPTGTPGALVTGLRAPWSIAFLGETALISQRDDALILEVLDGGGTREVGVVDGVRHGGEGGLLGLAVDAHSRLYVYSTGEGGNRVQRHALTGRPGSLGLGPAETVIGGLPSAGTHNGGRIAFGPDGMLYVTVGDAGRRAEAQDLDSLAGKILRLTPDGAVPADNPVPGSPVYSLGHRNPQGLAWSADGTLFSSEFGQNTWDELNVIVPGGNYGWPEAEGEVGDERFVDPVQQWATSAASPSGITVLGGTVFVANLRGGVLRSVPVADPATSSEHFAGEYGRLRDVVVSPAGTLWLLTNNTDGRGSPRGDDDQLLEVAVAEVP